MRKLRTILVVILAMLMSLALFACGGDDPEENPGGDNPGGDNPGGDNPGGDNPGGDNPGGDNPGGDQDTIKITRIGNRGIDTITLTDSNGEADYVTMCNALSITWRTNGSGAEAQKTLTGEDCAFGGEVAFHTVGTYTVTVTPNVMNPDGVSADMTVVIEHDFHPSEDDEHVQVCAYDGARRTTSEENVAIHYGDFHSGTANTRVPAELLGEGETGVYTNKTESNSQIEPLGSVAGKTIPSLTAGRLEPGTSITVRGTARTTWKSDASEGVTGWGLEDNAYWYFPVIGVADLYRENASAETGDYVGGTSVLVRGEGWVLYNGIGGTTDDERALASLTGGIKTNARTYPNYGSWENKTKGEAEREPAGWIQGQMPEISAWHDWYVYSFGQTSNSGDQYNSETDVEFTWNYREDGIMEIIYNYDYTGSPRVLTCYVKVPEATRGYYDTVLHGDYVDIQVNEVIRTETLTTIDFEYTSPSTPVSFFEGQAFDGSILNTRIRYEQLKDNGSDGWTNYSVSANQVYATTAEGITSAEADVAGTEWVSLDTASMNSDFNSFKIVVRKSGRDFVSYIPKADFNIVPNAIASAAGETVSIDDVVFANNDKLGAFDLSVAGEIIHLTLTGDAYAQTLSDAQKAKIANLTGDEKYVAIRLEGNKISSFLKGDLTVKSGTATVPYAVSYAEDDAVALVLALTKETAANDITIEGLQTKTVSIGLSAVKGFDVSSAATASLTLNGGGQVTLTYKIADDVEWNSRLFRINIGDGVMQGNEIAEYEAGETVGSAKFVSAQLPSNENGNTLTVVLQYPGVELLDFTDDYCKQVTLQVNGVTQTVDNIYYDMTFASDVANDKGVLENGYYIFAQNGRLYIAKAYNLSDLTYDQIKETTLNLNLNAGGNDLSSVKLIDLSYEVDRFGSIAFKNVSALPTDETAATITLSTVGTAGNSRDTDKGALVIISLDPSFFGIEKTDDVLGAYCFELNPAGTPDHYYSVNGATVERVAIEEELEKEIVKEGNCLETGLVAYVVKDEHDNVVFYLNIQEIGGSHHFDGATDGATCTLCGVVNHRTRAFPYTATLTDNEFFRMEGTYSANAQSYIYNGVTIRLTVGSDWYWIRPDAFVAKNDYGSGGDAEEIWHSLDGDPKDIALRTPVGKLNGVDGTEIAEEDFNAAKRSGTFEYVVSYANGVVTVSEALYKNGVSDKVFFSYSLAISDVTATSVSAQFGLDAATINGSGNVWYAQGNIVNNMIDEIVSTDLEGTETSDATFVVGDPVNGMIPVSGSGRAVELTPEIIAAVTEGGLDATGMTHYIAFAVKLENALGDDVVVTVRNTDGSKAANAIAQAIGTTVMVGILTDGSVTDYVLDFASYIASSKQGDLKLDLSGIAASSITSNLSGSANLVEGGEITVAFEGGEIRADDVVEINGTSLMVSELAASASLGNGVTVKTVNKTENTLTLVLTVAAPDLAQDLVGYTLNLKRGNVILAQETFDYLALPETAVAGDAKIDENTYAIANGNKLTFVIVDAKSGSNKIALNANNGAAIGTENLGLIRAYDLDYAITLDGVSFEYNNVLTAAATVRYSAVGMGATTRRFVVIVVDLAPMQIGEDTAYAFEVLPAVSAGQTVIYSVSATGDITASAPITLADASRVTLAQGSPDSLGTSAEAYKNGGDTAVFYYNVGVSASHGWSTDSVKYGLYVSSDGALLKSGDATNTKIEATEFNGTGAATAEKGITVSYWQNSATSDWDSLVLRTVYGTLNVTTPNLQMNVKSIPADAPAEIKTLSDKLGAENAFPTSAGAWLASGCAWDVLVNSNGAGVYVTVSMSKATGVTYYKNGVKVVEYPATMALGNGTIADFVELFMLCAAQKGVTAGTVQFAGSISISNMIFEKRALTADQAALRYSNYLAENALYPAAHVHSYDGTTDLCLCGTLNPNHGKTGGVPHNYVDNYCTICGALDPDHTCVDSDANGKCDLCGKTMATHTHSYVKGVCSCGELCKHEGATETCSVCGAVWTKTNVTEGNSFTPTGAAFGLWTLPSGVNLVEGGKIVIEGTQTSDLVQNWDALAFEFAEGFTGRTDVAGWTFGAASLGTDFTGVATITKADGTKSTNAAGDSFWAEFRSIFAGACKYSIEFAWTNDDAITVTIELNTATGNNNYLAVMNLPRTDKNVTAYAGIHLGAEDCTLTIESYSTWAWND